MLAADGEAVVHHSAGSVGHAQNGNVPLQPYEPIWTRRVVAKEIQSSIGEEVEIHDTPVPLQGRLNISQGAGIHLPHRQHSATHGHKQRCQCRVPCDEPPLFVQTSDQALEVVEGSAGATNLRHVPMLLRPQELGFDRRQGLLQAGQDFIHLAQNILFGVRHGGCREPDQFTVISLQNPLQPLAVGADGFPDLLDRLFHISAAAALRQLAQCSAVLVPEASVQYLLDQGRLAPQRGLQRLHPLSKSSPLVQR
mmetsp:Transcript_67307/g.160551  ORF Transcript_67307/g.160551 Transcript_67307/m.160551 type:complete len:252 (+) Transcript_67307:490-1245(+)